MRDDKEQQHTRSGRWLVSAVHKDAVLSEKVLIYLHCMLYDLHLFAIFFAEKERMACPCGLRGKFTHELKDIGARNCMLWVG